MLTALIPANQEIKPSRPISDATVNRGYTFGTGVSVLPAYRQKSTEHNSDPPLLTAGLQANAGLCCCFVMFWVIGGIRLFVDEPIYLGIADGRHG